ncbi:unnamed protein product [Rotaria magnacalcarata]|uniref:Peptidase S1 domain-containing protein n=2 Tax=Rotaria magnacalcarata TaxID=392030 RepID=A0A8S2JJC8_9BILA|nr:unnamed protein product [Rotaria magnacalcarata]
MPLTTLPPYFPKECGKQLYDPFGSRIYGGSFAPEHSWAIGWGRQAELTTASCSPQLKQASLNVMECDGFYDPSTYDNKKQICARASDGSGSPCGGDLGDPLMFQYYGQWYLNGIYSANGCRSDGRSIFFTRVSYYLSWIQEKIALAKLLTTQNG